MRIQPGIVAAVSFALFAWASPSFAQSPPGGNNPECLGSNCGTPKQQGGGCSCSCGCSVWVSYTDDGKTLAYTDDADGDGIPDDKDNCPFVANHDQADSDGDGVGDACDNCPTTPNKDQSDINGNGVGDVCDPDMDGDGVANAVDNCPTIPNADQAHNSTTSPLGDACNPDIDGDGILNTKDNCPLWANPAQNLPTDPTILAKDCQADRDGDGIEDAADNCPDVYNPDQSDIDHDGIGDLCDKDIDGDGVLNGVDNCPNVANPDQADSDNDGIGDACDPYYCYVVDPSNKQDCLDPQKPFQVSGGSHVDLQPGVNIRLPLFANRNGVAIEFTWVVTSRPQGSRAAIDHSVGAVSTSRNWMYAYKDGERPTFTPDVPGHYTLQLTGKLPFTDRVYSDANLQQSSSNLNIDVASTSGCTAVPAAPLAGLGLVLLSFLRRRRS